MDELENLLKTVAALGGLQSEPQPRYQPMCKFRNKNGKCDKKMGLCNGYKSKLHCKKRS